MARKDAQGAAGDDAARIRKLKRFLLLYFVYFLVGNLVLTLPVAKTWFVAPWTRLNSQWAATIATPLTGPFHVVETLVDTGGLTLSVKPGCNGVHALIMCVGAIVAFPASWSRRAMGVLLATAGIFAMNLVRLASLFYVAQRYPIHLELFHVYIWQPLIALLAFGLFLSWGTFVAIPRTPAESRKRVAAPDLPL